MDRRKFIYFDVGNVLFDVTNWMTDLADQYQKTYEDFRTIFDQQHDTLIKGTIPLRALWPIYIDKLKLNTRPEFDFEQFWLDHCIRIPEMHALVHQSVQTYNVGLLTNIYKGLLKQCIRQGRLPNVAYSSIINSSQCGYKKPQSMIYEIAENQANVSPEKILYIDNREDFLSLPKKRGWHTILFHSDAVSQSIDEIQTFLTQHFQ